MQDDIQYFEEQKKIYPKATKGKFRLLKWLIMLIAFVVYYGTPWLRYDRGPNVPNQAVLIDMVGSKAYLFGIEIWRQEIYYITGILIFAAVALFLITSLLGRVWCGYFCFQTIWTDLFIAVEQLVQGDRNKRIKLDKGPWTFEKISKKFITHFLWIMIGIATGGAWVFYFNDAPTLWENLLQGDISTPVLVWVLALTASTYLMAGFAREQVCTYMCPYARFQSAMFDNKTVIIGYDKQAGEPRGHFKKQPGVTPQDKGQGYCVECTACVQVCPMGIDIRDGLQMECIACGLCIDACDDVMKKMEFPAKLIRYDIHENFEKGTPEKITAKTFLRGRFFYYSAILGVIGGIMVYGLMNRTQTELHVFQQRNPVYVTLSDGTIRNGYIIKLLNKTHHDRHFSLKVTGLKAFNISMGTLLTDKALQDLEVLADSSGQFRIFITAPNQEQARSLIKIHLEDKQTGELLTYKTVFSSMGL